MANRPVVRIRCLVAAMAVAISSSLVGEELSLTLSRPVSAPLRLSFHDSGGLVWVAQDSYDLQNWRDLGAFSADGHGLYVFDDPCRRSEGNAVRFFRAVQRRPLNRQQALDQARARWQALALATYEYNYQFEHTFLSWGGVVSVQDGKVIETIPNEGERVEVTAYTVAALFDQIQRAIDGNAFVLHACYHPSFGYPESVFIDSRQLLADDEFSYSIASVRPPESSS